MRADASIWFSLITADIIVLGGWIVIAILLWTVASRKVSDDVEDTVGNTRFAFYGLGCLFWPAAVILAFYFLGKPETARTGRGMVGSFIGTITMCVFIAIAIVTAGGAYFPEFLRL